jgi:hypothetical protein
MGQTNAGRVGYIIGGRTIPPVSCNPDRLPTARGLTRQPYPSQSAPNATARLFSSCGENNREPT